MASEAEASIPEAGSVRAAADTGPAYDAFISYSHRADGKLAPALQSALHRFAKPWWKLRAVTVFRDETSLAAAHDLTEAIRSALGGARFFILLASPLAAQSTWVEREVRAWLETKPAENILIVLTDGTIAWDEDGDFDWSQTDALPRAISGAFPAEPLWVDLSWAHTDEQLSVLDPRFQQAVARLAARLHGKSLDTIAGEEVRQHRRTRRIARSAVAAIAVLAIAAAAGAWLGFVGQRRAERNLEQAVLAVDHLETNVARDMLDLSGVSVGLRVKMLQEAEDVLKNLDAGGEADAVGRSRALAYTAFAAAYADVGDQAQAEARATAAIRLLSSLRDHRTDDDQVEADLAAGYKIYGDILRHEGRLAEAVGANRKSIDLATALIERHPAAPLADEWRLMEFRNLIAAGDSYYAAADAPNAVCDGREVCLAGARQAFADALDLIATVSDGQSVDWTNALLVSQERLGKVYSALGDWTRAEGAYRISLDAIEGLHRAKPENTKWRENLMALQWRMGSVRERQCRFAEALGYYDAALDLARALHRADPNRDDWYRELSLSLEYVGRTQRALGKPELARAAYRESLDAREALRDREPENGKLAAEAASLKAALAALDADCGMACSPPPAPQGR